MDEIPLIIWPVKKIAERDGVTREAISKQVRKLIEAQPETPVELDGRGRIVGVSLAHFEEYRERFLNPAKSAAVIRPAQGKRPTSPPAGDSFEEARRQKEWISVRREQIRHQEEVGLLVRKDRLQDACLIIGNDIRTAWLRLPNFADDIVTEAVRSGVVGTRRLLKNIGLELGNQLADKMEAIAAAEPPTEPLIGEAEIERKTDE